jgi:hypothetical protein
VLDVPQELGLHLVRITMRLTAAIRRVTGCEDFNIVVNSGAAAGQDEPHYHVHIIPRREGDGFDIPLPFNGSEMPDRTVLDAYAARIISALRDPMRIDAAEGETDGDGDGHSERVVTVPLFNESSSKKPSQAPQPSAERRPARWRVREGAHGELLYEPLSDTGA